jgi:hypothetical protein
LFLSFFEDGPPRKKPSFLAFVVLAKALLFVSELFREWPLPPELP